MKLNELGRRKLQRNFWSEPRIFIKDGINMIQEQMAVLAISEPSKPIFRI